MGNPLTTDSRPFGYYRRVLVSDGRVTLRLLGPVIPLMLHVDVEEFRAAPVAISDACLDAAGVVHDPDLNEQFDLGMGAGPWLDWVAERRPDLAWAAALYGKLMAEAYR